MQPEEIIQRAVVLHLQIRGVDGLEFIHVPNGEQRHPAVGKKLKAMGVKRGVPDLLLWHNKNSYALEIKTAKGRESAEQVDMRLRLQRQGVITGIAYGFDAAITVLENWKLLKGSVA